MRASSFPVDFTAFGARSLAPPAALYLGRARGYMFGGKLYGVPHELSDYVMWVNTAALKAAGLGPNGYPHTWEQMAAIGKKLTTVVGGKTVKEAIALPFNFPAAEYLVLDAMARQAGGSLFSADGTKALLNTPPVIKAVTTLASRSSPMASRSALNGPTAGADRTLFGNGVAQMMLTGGTCTAACCRPPIQRSTPLPSRCPIRALPPDQIVPGIWRLRPRSGFP